MKVLNYLRPENGLTEDPLYYFNFERFEDRAADCYFFLADFYSAFLSGKFDDKPKIALTLEEPNLCLANTPHDEFGRVSDRILTICPYTADLFNNRTFVFFPFNENWIPPDVEKIIDVAYFGSIPLGIPWRSYMTNVMSKFNFCFGNYSEGNAKKITYPGKIKLLSQSKVAVVHGLCNVSPSNINQYRQFPRAADNRAFSHLEKGLMPQIKSRMFEAAFCKTLILCQKDYWNPIERFFEPEKEFLYFSNETELSRILSDAIKNFEHYSSIIDSAFEKANNNYTTEHFVNRYLFTI